MSENSPKPADDVNIHAMTMDELRHEAARILSLYHGASDANEMLDLSTRYTKIDMLLDKREKLLAQGVPMSEIIERTTPPTPKPDPEPPAAPAQARELPDDPEAPVDDSAFSEFDQDPAKVEIPQSEAPAQFGGHVGAPSTSDLPPETSRPDSDPLPPPDMSLPESTLDDATREMNVSDLTAMTDENLREGDLNTDADSNEEEITAEMNVEELSQLESRSKSDADSTPAVDDSKPLSVPDIEIERESESSSEPGFVVDTNEPADRSEMPTPIVPQDSVPEPSDESEVDPSEVPTPIMPLQPVVDADAETPVPPTSVHDVDLETPVEPDIDDDDKNQTLSIERKKKSLLDSSDSSDVGFENAQSPPTDDDEPDDDNDTVIIKKKKFSFFDKPIEEIEEEISSSDATSKAQEPAAEELSELPESSPQKETEHPQPRSDEATQKTDEQSGSSTEGEPFSTINAERDDVISEPVGKESSSTESFDVEESPIGSIEFDSEEKTDADASFDADDADIPDDVLTTPFEASDAEMESFEVDASDESLDSEKVPRGSLTESATDADDATPSRDESETQEKTSDFEDVLASLNQAIERGSRSEADKPDASTAENAEPIDDSEEDDSVATPEFSPLMSDNSSDSGEPDAFGDSNMDSSDFDSGGDLMSELVDTNSDFNVESSFDLDASRSEATGDTSGPAETDEQDETFPPIEVDTQVPPSELGVPNASTAFSDLASDDSDEEVSAEAKPEDDEAPTGNLPPIGNLPSFDEITSDNDSEDDTPAIPDMKGSEASPTPEPPKEDKQESALPEFPPLTGAEDSPPDAAPSIPDLNASTEVSENEDKKIPEPAASSVPTTPAPVPPIDNIPPSASENLPKFELKGEKRICGSCGEATEITEPRCQKCFYLDESYGIVNTVMSGDTQQVSKLLKVKPEIVQTRTKKHNWTLLHMSASGGNMRLTKLLIEKGCPVNAANIYGKTALHYAAIKGHATVIHVLLSAGADKEMKFDNKTPLQLAMENGRSEAIAALQA